MLEKDREFLLGVLNIGGTTPIVASSLEDCVAVEGPLPQSRFESQPPTRTATSSIPLANSRPEWRKAMADNTGPERRPSSRGEEKKSTFES